VPQAVGVAPVNRTAAALANTGWRNSVFRLLGVGKHDREPTHFVGRGAELAGRRLRRSLHLLHRVGQPQDHARVDAEEHPDDDQHQGADASADQPPATEALAATIFDVRTARPFSAHDDSRGRRHGDSNTEPVSGASDLRAVTGAVAIAITITAMLVVVLAGIRCAMSVRSRSNPDACGRPVSGGADDDRRGVDRARSHVDGTR
jgi:hypothetical protein